MNIYDITKKVDVSVATVSHVLNGLPKVSKKGTALVSTAFYQSSTACVRPQREDSALPQRSTSKSGGYKHRTNARQAAARRFVFP